jgi:transposase
MIDRGGPGQTVGEALLEHAHVLFAWWHWVRDGTWKRSTFQSYVRTLRASFKMEFGVGHAKRLSPRRPRRVANYSRARRRCGRSCGVEGIEPTNNRSERQLRPAVLWRKVSYGTQSERGEVALSRRCSRCS